MTAEYDFTLKETITKIIDMCCNMLQVNISRAAYTRLTNEYIVALAGAHARNIPLQWDWETVVRDALTKENQGLKDFANAAYRNMTNTVETEQHCREYREQEEKWHTEERRVKEKKKNKKK